MKTYFQEVNSEKKYRGFLSEDPIYLYIIKSGHYSKSLPNQNSSKLKQNSFIYDDEYIIYYVIEEDPHEPGKMFQMTKKEIKEKYNIEL